MTSFNVRYQLIFSFYTSGCIPSCVFKMCHKPSYNEHIYKICRKINIIFILWSFFLSFFRFENSYMKLTTL